jgi:hypothetical protein
MLSELSYQTVNIAHVKTLLTGTKTTAGVETSTSTCLICGAATNGDDDPPLSPVSHSSERICPQLTEIDRRNVLGIYRHFLEHLISINAVLHFER